MEKAPKFIHQPDTYNLTAPNEVVPILVEMFQPKSVLDVGCGIGTWLKCFNNFGIADTKGIDGDYVDREQLKRYIDISQFEPVDLTYPFDLHKTFDLVLSLEVAEHLPAASAHGFIKSLCKHGDTVVFSAAIPGQGGQNHVNEQWKEYWIDMFLDFGFKPYDLLRWKIWNNKKVDWWYKQNILVFSKKDLTHFLSGDNSIVEAVHPDLFSQHLDYIIYLQQYCKDLEIKIHSNEQDVSH